MEQRRFYATSPYPIALYRRFLEQALAFRRCEIRPFTEASFGDGPRARLYVRHDIDTAACVANTPALLEIDRELGIPAAVYVRVDDEDYPAESCRAMVSRCHEIGLEVGLHTACYTHDDSFAAFSDELDKFTTLFGFSPLSFTMHGLGTKRQLERQDFCAKIIKSMKKYGLRFTDCRPEFRNYDYVIEDCHLEGGGSNQRFLYNDVYRIPKFFRPSRDYLFLTHPCYWT
ncbi:polysaccharide deacetylase family protein [Azospirillum agricola]|uniref:hypothetical protein n=1 Tax=Azospirillum agricola TaxID=1720247 RepID=UPI001B3C08EA|nr:hypothetical protein [Azospirillum agricola]